MEDKPDGFSRYRFGYVIDYREITVRFPAEATHFSLLDRVQTRSAAHPVLMDTGGPFLQTSQSQSHYN
jgi:hypothetical protein